MKIIDGFRLRTIMGESIIVGEGVKQINFDKIISLNESAALMWQHAQDNNFTCEDLADVLTANYEIDRATALQDAKETVENWMNLGLIEE